MPTSSRWWRATKGGVAPVASASGFGEGREGSGVQPCLNISAAIDDSTLT
jgi:hypothetical protein